VRDDEESAVHDRAVRRSPKSTSGLDPLRAGNQYQLASLAWKDSEAAGSGGRLRRNGSDEGALKGSRKLAKLGRRKAAPPRGAARDKDPPKAYSGPVIVAACCCN